MLHQQAVPKRALELLTGIQANPFFTPLRLVGGTALALQIGHRISIDLDFFGDFPLQHQLIAQELAQYGSVTNVQNTPTVCIFQVDGVKIDFVNYKYAWLDKPIKKDGFVLAGKRDIAAMKISAITGRGTKKDFIDLNALLDDFTLAEMIALFDAKYPDGTTYLALKSLNYFVDADRQKAPQMLIPYNWEAIKERITAEVRKLVL